MIKSHNMTNVVICELIVLMIVDWYEILWHLSLLVFVLLQREDLTGYPMLQLVAQEVGADWWAKVVHGATSCEECPSYEEGAQRIAEQDEAEPEPLEEGLDNADINYLNTYGE